MLVSEMRKSGRSIREGTVAVVWGRFVGLLPLHGMKLYLHCETLREQKLHLGRSSEVRTAAVIGLRQSHKGGTQY